MTFLSGNTIPEASKLSDHYLATDGVLFSSGAGYVAVVDLGTGHSTSGTNGIGGSTPSGTLTYDRDYPITVSFFNPSDPSQPGVTDFVSVRGDLLGDGLTVTLNAFNTAGTLIDSVTDADTGGETLELATPGIHSVQFLGTHDEGGVALDNFTFNPVSPAPEPFQTAALSLGALGLSLLTLKARRGKSVA